MSTAIERQGNTLTVRPEGPLDTVRTPVLENELQPQLDGIEHIIMDFNGVKYIASSGLRLLLVLENQMEERGGELQVIHACEAVLKVFSLVGFREVVQVIPD